VTETPLSPRQVEELLAELHGERPLDLEPLAGGFWSSAFGYRIDERELVLRVSDLPAAFDVERAAMAFHGSDLPVPDVLRIGEVAGRSYAISQRSRGRFLEAVVPGEAEVAGPTLVRLLRALRAVPAPAAAAVDWHGGVDGDGSTWEDWLLDGLVEDPAKRVSGWRATINADPDLDRLFRACEDRVRSLAASCPERRDLVHGDLLHANVLLVEDASRVSAVFSWKCSVRGDFLFDVAWCTFWGAWHPGIEAVDVWARVLADPSLDDDPEALVDAAERHHCYELQIGASHLGWCAWTGNENELRRVATHTAQLLERGPLLLPRR